MAKKTETATNGQTDVQDVHTQNDEDQTSPATTPTPAGNGGQQSGEKTFTQAELNNIIQQRLQQERSKFADYEALRQQVHTLTSERQTVQQRADQLAEQNQQLATTAQKTGIEAAIAKAASKIGLDADAAYRLSDQGKFALDDSGSLTNADDVVKAVAEQYPGLLKRPLPVASAVNPAASEKAITPEVEDARRRKEYFGGNAANFWSGGSVRSPVSNE